jgi:ribosomal protein S18 acetylase RimI-like enzyme
MQVRRAMQVQMRADPVPRSWWEACTYGHFDRWQFQLLPRGSAAPLASVMLWNMEAFSATWGLRTVGLVDLEMAPGQRRQGMATYLVADVLRQLHEQGVALVEATVRESNSIALALFSKLGFERVDAGTIYRKC